jgi:hypothetical protein
MAKKQNVDQEVMPIDLAELPSFDETFELSNVKSTLDIVTSQDNKKKAIRTKIALDENKMLDNVLRKVGQTKDGLNVKFDVDHETFEDKPETSRGFIRNGTYFIENCKMCEAGQPYSFGIGKDKIVWTPKETTVIGGYSVFMSE